MLYLRHILSVFGISILCNWPQNTTLQPSNSALAHTTPLPAHSCIPCCNSLAYKIPHARYSMRLTLSRAVKEIHILRHVTLPLAFFLASYATLNFRPAIPSLLAPTFSWALIWLACSFRCGLGIHFPYSRQQRLCWAAGSLLALAQVCEAALANKGALRWGKVSLVFQIHSNKQPLTIHLGTTPRCNIRCLAIAVYSSAQPFRLIRPIP